MENFFWLGPDGREKTIGEAVAEWIRTRETRAALARMLVDSALDEKKAAAFSVAARTPINGLDLLAIINEAVKRGAANPAARLAKLRHAENYALMEEALEFWRSNINPLLSAEKAASILERVVPLSHKKLAELVSKEKKKRAE